MYVYLLTSQIIVMSSKFLCLTDVVKSVPFVYALCRQRLIKNRLVGNNGRFTFALAALGTG